jgi:hypothetical protein
MVGGIQVSPALPWWEQVEGCLVEVLGWPGWGSSDSLLGFVTRDLLPGSFTEPQKTVNVTFGYLSLPVRVPSPTTSCLPNVEEFLPGAMYPCLCMPCSSHSDPWTGNISGSRNLFEMQKLDPSPDLLYQTSILTKSQSDS